MFNYFLRISSINSPEGESPNHLGGSTMTAESMLMNGFILAPILILVGLAWGFLLLKIQGGEPE
jgi:cytochrome b6-f complex subunit 7